MKQSSLRLLSAAALSTVIGLSTAHADVLDFEGDALAGTLLLAGDTLNIGAYTLTTRVAYGTIDSASSLGGQAPTGNATQFYFNGNDGALGLARTDGGLFDLGGFSASFVAQDPASPQTTVLMAVGTKSDNSTVSACGPSAAAAPATRPSAATRTQRASRPSRASSPSSSMPAR